MACFPYNNQVEIHLKGLFVGDLNKVSLYFGFFGYFGVVF